MQNSYRLKVRHHFSIIQYHDWPHQFACQIKCTIFILQIFTIEVICMNSRSANVDFFISSLFIHLSGVTSYQNICKSFRFSKLDLLFLFRVFCLRVFFCCHDFTSGKEEEENKTLFSNQFS